eukprot:TRINITY_DN55720_c0_g1_i1.p2 TRINITY_DN55720_c0_g1~~TRINITY_DN55720_c0_g1_i1.p2  ORF type:complete len:260 (+),score=70.58 TRINITY_DN55720_c0_g1_i1:54-782(+)
MGPAAAGAVFPGFGALGMPQPMPWMQPLQPQQQFQEQLRALSALLQPAAGSGATGDGLGQLGAQAPAPAAGAGNALVAGLAALLQGDGAAQPPAQAGGAEGPPAHRQRGAAPPPWREGSPGSAEVVEISPPASPKGRRPPKAHFIRVGDKVKRVAPKATELTAAGAAGRRSAHEAARRERRAQQVAAARSGAGNGNAAADLLTQLSQLVSSGAVSKGGKKQKLSDRFTGIAKQQAVDPWGMM